MHSKSVPAQAVKIKKMYDEAASVATTKLSATCFCAKAAGAAFKPR